MTRLKVIEGIKKQAPDFFEIYSRIFINALNKGEEIFGNDVNVFDIVLRKKIVLFGVKLINTSSGFF